MKLKSSEPFWLVKNGILYSYPSLQYDITCDVLIVGGGITGSLIAHQCVEDGYNTVLIDKREIANGSSSATTSMLQYEIDVSLHELIEKIGEEGAVASYHACADSILQLQHICKQIRSKSGFHKKKSLYFAARKKDVISLQKEYTARQQAGFKVAWLDAKDIGEKYQIAATHGGILSQIGASVDAYTLVHELLHYNHQRGLRIFDKTELMQVRYHPRSQEVLVNSGATIKTRRIIYCVGYESAGMIPEKFVDLISTYAVVSEINPEHTKAYQDILVWNTAKPYIYMRTTDDGRFLIGGEDERFQNPQKRDRLISRKEEKLVKTFYKHLPHTSFLPDFSWAGTFGETQDGLPYIGTHKAFKNSYFVLGFGGNGITFSIAGMEMCSYWLQGKKHPLSQWFRFGR